MKFKHHDWNYFNFKGPRTNNYVEGRHSRLNKVVGKPHPNIYEIIDIFTKMKIVDAGSWSTAGPKTKMGEAKTNPELVCLIQFWYNVSE